MLARNPAIVQAYAMGCDSMKEVAQAFNIHYATVSRIVKKGSGKSTNARPDPYTCLDPYT